MKPDVLAVATLPPAYTQRLREAFTFHDRVNESDPAAFATIAPKIRGLAARANIGVTRDLIAQLPALEIISIFGVGYDKVDLEAARERGIVVTNTPDVLTDDVADLALALMLSVARQFRPAERFARRGAWKTGTFRLTRKVSGSRLGIIGLGRIGSAVARRAEGFGMSISYTDIKAKPGIAYQFFASARELAANVDFLVAAAYGGPSTRSMVNATVLEALGSKGFLINIARGSLVDEPALVEALQRGTIAGAALDVFVDEPNVPAELLNMDNVVITPHIASGTEQTRKAMGDLAFANLEAHFAGKPVLTPVPR